MEIHIPATAEHLRTDRSWEVYTLEPSTAEINNEGEIPDEITGAQGGDVQ